MVFVEKGVPDYYELEWIGVACRMSLVGRYWSFGWCRKNRMSLCLGVKIRHQIVNYYRIGHAIQLSLPSNFTKQASHRYQCVCQLLFQLKLFTSTRLILSIEINTRENHRILVQSRLKSLSPRSRAMRPRDWPIYSSGNFELSIRNRLK